MPGTAAAVPATRLAARPPALGEVKLVRWPAESARRARYQALGVLRLLVVEAGAPAPICSDVREDWVRPPTTEADLRARIAALRARAAAHQLPQLDPCGILRLGERSVAVSPTETELLECLIQRFRSLVPKATLLHCLPGRHGGADGTPDGVPDSMAGSVAGSLAGSVAGGAAGRDASRNALDLHIMRLRRRISAVGLVIRTVHRRGYLLEPLDGGAPEPSGMPSRLIEFPGPALRGA